MSSRLGLVEQQEVPLVERLLESGQVVLGLIQASSQGRSRLGRQLFDGGGVGIGLS